MTIRNRRLIFVTFAIALVLSLWLLFFAPFLSSQRPTGAQLTAAARYEFERKALDYAMSYNDVLQDYGLGKADVRKYRKTANLWDKLYADPGWMK